jgi:hypothetical protein
MTRGREDTGIAPFHLELEEVGGAGDARVVVADRAFAKVREPGVVEVDELLGDVAEVLLHALQVLGRRGHDAGLLDGAVLAQSVAVEQDPPGRLGRGASDTADDRRRRRDERAFGELVVVDDPDRLLAGVHGLDGPHDDALVRVADDRPEPHLAGERERARGEAVVVQRVSGEGPDQVRSVPLAHDLVGVAVRDLDLLEHLVPAAVVDLEPAVRDDLPLVEGVLLRVAEGDELVILLDFRELEARDEPDGLLGELEGADQLRPHREELLGLRAAVEAADPDVHGVDLAAPEDRHERIADLLELEAVLHRLRVLLGEGDGVGEAEEIRRVEEIDVERVALDPLPAVQEPAELPQLPVDGDAERPLHGVAGAHLVGDRADAADPGRDIRGLRVGSPAQEPFEETRGLEDPELHVLDCPVADPQLDGAFAFDPGEILHGDRAFLHAVS